MELSELKGIGAMRLKAFHAAGIFTLRDLVYALPVSYRDMSRRATVQQAQPGEKSVLSLKRLGSPKLMRKGSLTRISCPFGDDTGTIQVCYFNQLWMKKQLENVTRLCLYGSVSLFGGQKQLLNPTVVTEPRIVAVYKPIEGLPQKTHETAVGELLPLLEGLIEDELPLSLRQEYHLMPLVKALRILHRPPSMEQLGEAQRRFSFEQMLLYQAAVQTMKLRRGKGIPLRIAPGAGEAFWATLPFAPTGAQRRTLEEIAGDMCRGRAMARMVQGDVGSGKTAVAMGAMLAVAENGYQAAMMAPTEILARQHYAGMKGYFEQRGIGCGLLLGGMPAGERKAALEAIRSGSWQVIIGTHALIGKSVEYRNLALCITDEQHRFGVAQRTALIGKGRQEGCDPHLLVMTATPIPRSLALIFFGDLDLSVIDELPPGRKPVETRLVPEGKRQAMYGFIEGKLQEGRQAYFVCSLVESSEGEEGLKAAKDYAAHLGRTVFPKRRIGVTWGTQPSAEKARVLEDFSSGKLDILVATTVIEVGVNVPNATLMIIEDASRYGLAQLHQLRGRVGRGSEQSWCFLLSEPNPRLKVLVSTHDGFAIADEDLNQRGPGEVLGTRQHGESLLPGGKAAFGNMKLLYEAAACAGALAQDPARAEEWSCVSRMAEKIVGNLSEKVSLN